MSGVLTRGRKFAHGKGIGCKRDSEGNTIGRANEHPVLDIMRYEVEFGDGKITELTANVIAESMYAQVDSEEHDTLLMDCMVDYKRNDHVPTIQYQKILVKGRPSLRHSTVGWFICIQWKDGLISWEKLSDMK